MLSIDLHGLIEYEALMELDAALLSLEFSNEDTLEVITGNGFVLKGMAIEHLQRNHWDFEIPTHNSGCIIVYKK